jgi:hypothetical protein
MNYACGWCHVRGCLTSVYLEWFVITCARYHELKLSKSPVLRTPWPPLFKT